MFWFKLKFRGFTLISVGLSLLVLKNNFCVQNMEFLEEVVSDFLAWFRSNPFIRILSFKKSRVGRKVTKEYVNQPRMGLGPWVPKASVTGYSVCLINLYEI